VDGAFSWQGDGRRNFSSPLLRVPPTEAEKEAKDGRGAKCEEIITWSAHQVCRVEYLLGFG
jgi:hypothetical protein